MSRDTKHDPAASGNPKAHTPDRKGGDAVQNAQQWDGGSAGSKGNKASGKQNQNSSAKR
ncbi:MAG TPA: hypothetical protein VHG30_05340 [Microvirga sp.]|jgi:hypothetical protein|nr:hypothetical protein [Microvirga sp.]